MSRNLFRTSPLMLTLLVAAFFAGFFVQPALADCTRVQATYSYDVQGYFCKTSYCIDCSALNGCCYVEYGTCLESRLENMNSIICGGLCGSHPAPM